MSANGPVRKFRSIPTEEDSTPSLQPVANAKRQSADNRRESQQKPLGDRIGLTITGIKNASSESRKNATGNATGMILNIDRGSSITTPNGEQRIDGKANAVSWASIQ